jgi:peptide-N4-(N-acetyl-beta-glucosaminyl)asparagine amidase
MISSYITPSIFRTLLLGLHIILDDGGTRKRIHIWPHRDHQSSAIIVDKYDTILEKGKWHKLTFTSNHSSVIMSRQASTHSTLSAEDEQFRRRIQGAIETVKAWDADEALLRQVCESIPFADLRSNHDNNNKSNNNKFSRPEDAVLEPTVRFVQRLARYFQDKMTWINQPACPCQQCTNNNNGSNSNKKSTMDPQGTRGPETEEEKAGGASRVEVYKCSQCQQLVTFPRYNKVSKLFDTHSGRCGEYANLFGVYCRAVGLETRYIHDVTDHVWTEVYIPNHGGGSSSGGSGSGYWMMIDSCEGIIDETSMYEAGWGKKLSYMIAVSTTHVVDVSPKYTRQWNDGDFQARRRASTSSELAGEQILQQINDRLKSESNMTVKETEQVDRRLKRELHQLRQERHQSEWEHQYGRGRISGSLAWKSQRQEDGHGNKKGKSDAGGSKKDAPAHSHVETYYPVAHHNNDTSTISIAVRPNPVIRHEAIQVNGVACATGVFKSLSVVVVDHEYLGCILQSRCCLSLQQLLDFVETVPANRIVVVAGSIPIPNANKKKEEEEDEDESSTSTVKEKLSRQLGGFDATLVKDGDSVLYIGQILAKPDWAVCCSAKDAPFGFVLEADADATQSSSIISTQKKERKLKTISNFRSASVVGRVPEPIMSLQTQKLATHTHKRDAFLSCVSMDMDNMDNNQYCKYSGYTTAPGLPVYLLGETAYPLTQTEATATADQGNNKHNVWTTFLLLPPPLVAEDDIGVPDDDDLDSEAEATKSSKQQVPLFEVPVDTNFFVQNLGPQLLRGQSRISTVEALQNTRLVAFYFSAHWCGRKCSANILRSSEIDEFVWFCWRIALPVPRATLPSYGTLLIRFFACTLNHAISVSPIHSNAGRNV